MPPNKHTASETLCSPDREAARSPSRKRVLREVTALYTAQMEKPKVGSARKAERIGLSVNNVLVHFTRSLEQGSVMGYILAAGPRFFLLALVDENIRFNGFQCLRLQDVRNLQVPAKQTAFVEAALKLRGQKRPRTPRVNVQTIQELLSTAGRLFPVITIHRELVAPDVCHIGKVVSVSESEVSLLEIDADARWEDEILTYRTKQITRIDFGGDYEQALVLVGNLPAKPIKIKRKA